MNAQMTNNEYYLRELMVSSSVPRPAPQLQTRLERPTNAKLASTVSIPASIYQRDASDMNTNCVICLDQLQEGDEVVKLSLCRHLFHVKCINFWIRQKSTCPLCRLQLSA